MGEGVCTLRETSVGPSGGGGGSWFSVMVLTGLLSSSRSTASVVVSAGASDSVALRCSFARRRGALRIRSAALSSSGDAVSSTIRRASTVFLMCSSLRRTLLTPGDAGAGIFANRGGSSRDG